MPGDASASSVADDEPIARDICRAVLRGAGFDVRVAADGAETVRSFRQHKDQICAVVLDRAMPNFGGEQAPQRGHASTAMLRRAALG